MPHAKLTLTLPDGTWVKDVSTTHPDATIKVMAAVPGDTTGFALIRVTGPDITQFLSDMRDHRAILGISVVQQTDNEATIHFETAKPLLLFSSKHSGMPIELPVTIQDGVATVEVTGSRNRLSQLATQLREHGLQFHVEYIQERLHSSQLLSERQREVITQAVEQGYYDTPREISLTDLASNLEIAKSTCSEILHRAEETIIKDFVSQLPEQPTHETLESDPIE